jgi:mycothiol system anti-sigma-R factor
MTCAEFVDALDAYLDDELSIRDILRMHGHVRSCERCHRVMASEALLHTLIADDATLDRSPESLRERILRRAVAKHAEDTGTRSAPSPPNKFVFFPALLVAAFLVGLLLVVPWLPASRDSEDAMPLAVEAAAKHLLYTGTRGRVLQVRTSDPSEIARWLEGGLGLSVKVPQLDGADGRLLGARVSSLADDPAAYLLYEWRGRRVSLFVTRSATGANRRGAEDAVDDVELHTSIVRGVVIGWWEEEDEGRLYVAAFTGEPTTLREFASLCIRSGLSPKPE